MRRAIRLIPFILVILLAWFATFNHVAIADWLFLRSYEPPTEIADISASMNLTEQGKKYFYASDPKLNEKDAFNKNCPFPERSFVLGCYTSERRIYILDVKENELDGIEDVTAVHEMLHAAYDRLSFSEKEEVNRLVLNAYKGIDDARLEETVSEYEKDDAESVPNELHSILATEVPSLPQELEDYYSQYFTDGRQATVQTFKAYESVFAELENRISVLKDEVNELKNEINGLQASLEQIQAELERVNQQMEQYRNQNRTEEYNELVPRQNRLVNEYNSQLSQLNLRIESHNRKVKEVNSLVYRQNDLVKAIDSKEAEAL